MGRSRSGQSSACCVPRDGVFPASHCIKLVGVLGKSRHLDTAIYSLGLDILIIYPTETGERLAVRGCSSDGGTLTADTELVRASHCGAFYFEDRSAAVSNRAGNKPSRRLKAPARAFSWFKPSTTASTFK